MKKLIIVTDLGHLKAYRVTQDVMEESPAIDLVRENKFEHYESRVADRMSDQAGQFPGGIGHPGQGYGEEHHEAEEIQKQQLHRVAKAVEDVMVKEKCEFVYLAVPQPIHRALCDLLPAALRMHLAKEIAADLVKVPKAELLKRFDLA